MACTNRGLNFMRREYYRQAFHLLNYHDEEDGELASKIGKIAYDSLKTDIFSKSVLSKLTFSNLL